MKPKTLLGIIADDFTGASDAASFAVKGGLETILFDGVPRTRDLPYAEVVVIALKSRTQETEAAVDDSIAAFEYLRGIGARQFYNKYCSTFDSTPEGNIGPISDALLDAVDGKFSVICPALPANDRKVRDGILYVDGKPLAETHMREHPLTPMTKSFLPDLMDPQSRYPSVVLTRDQFGEAHDLPSVDAARYYLVPDYDSDDDGAAIIRMFPDLKLYTGGSGLIEHLARRLAADHKTDDALKLEPTDGRVLLVSGSLSVATQSQCRYFVDHDLGEAIRVRPEDLADNTLDIDRILDQHTGDTPLLLYSARNEDGSKLDVDNAAELLEEFFGKAAAKGIEHGYTNIICAGGETSGAVTQALDLVGFQIGQSIDPGVPVMAPLSEPGIRLVLKSGNFGAEDFFAKAIREVKRG